jgi:hypothetical protein
MNNFMVNIRFHRSNGVYFVTLFEILNDSVRYVLDFVYTFLKILKYNKKIMGLKMINVFSLGLLLFSFVLIAQPIVAKLTRMYCRNNEWVHLQLPNQFTITCYISLSHDGHFAEGSTVTF